MSDAGSDSDFDDDEDPDKIEVPGKLIFFKIFKNLMKVLN